MSRKASKKQVVVKESLIQSAIEAYLATLESMGKLVYQKNNSGAYRTQRGGWVRYGKAGSPDFYIFLKGGKTIHLEVKNEKGRLNSNQKDFKKSVEKLEHIYVIVRSVEDVEVVLDKSKVT